jgi:hypothetical protein
MNVTINLTEEQAKVLRISCNAYGFLTDTDVEKLMQNVNLRLLQCLVRCNGMRVVTPLQDVAHLITIIEKEGSDYVRDVSFTAAQLDIIKQTFHF